MAILSDFEPIIKQLTEMGALIDEALPKWQEFRDAIERAVAALTPQERALYDEMLAGGAYTVDALVSIERMRASTTNGSRGTD